MKTISALLLGFLCLATTSALANTNLPKLFLYFGPSSQTGDYNEKLQLNAYQKILSNPCVSGAQVVYTWKELEPEKNSYNFSRITKDIAFLNSIHKKLFIQIRSQSFEPDIINVPDYIKNGNSYGSGVAKQFDIPGQGLPVTVGWMRRIWEPTVSARWQLLIKKLGEQFDGKIYGINLSETAVDFDPNNLPQGYTTDRYFETVLATMGVLREAFPKSIVVQYVNFFPDEWDNDHNYMGRLFSYAIQHQIGLGGPDVVPYRKSQMHNSYPFFHQYKGKLIAIAMAVQPGDYTYTKPNGKEHYHFSDFYYFATEYLGANILFWNVQEPFLSVSLVPMLTPRYFTCDI